MSVPKTPLLIPVENQVRELDPKLLLACVAAERGFPAILGWRRQIGFRAARLPRGVYLAKSMTVRSARFFALLRRLGHEIVVWDEEALVHHVPEQYYGRRLTPRTLRHVSLLLAWGEENAELFRKYPEYDGTPIHVTGNPRVDLLRREVRPVLEPEARRLRERFGDFVLVNTSFSMVNGFLPSLNLLNPGAGPEGGREPGTAARGLDPEFAEGWWQHKRALFEHFAALVPELSRAFPDRSVVVRPHPAENHDTWRELASGLPNAHVLHEGNVVPWLMAARAVIHNGCTTGLESFVVGVPALAYRPAVAPGLDFDLPNALSHECFDRDALLQALRRVLAGELGPPDDAERRRLIGSHLAALAGPLACERIALVLERHFAQGPPPRPPLGSLLGARLGITRRRLEKRYVKSRRPGHRNDPGFQRQFFEGTSLERIRARIGDFGRQLGRFDRLRVRELAPQVFRIEA